jgi:hypothetical protein
MTGEGSDARHGDCPDSVRRDAAGWVLGALDGVDSRHFAAHLITCRACQITVAELQHAARALLALPPLRPPGHLAADALARVRQYATEHSDQSDSGSRLTSPFTGAAGIDISKGSNSRPARLRD